ncbi:14800_t:CDS:1 [Acaulospora morrowiae]|uniref:14800_t:CDS:1 n=1 Tax=Acaulospora morrowiae TaxID=94023 RepID=A0A9N9EY49_9GLOM|nr:14800_t:CDS:1 [Acaulospora morrowiae]
MSQSSNTSGDIDPFDARLYFISILKKVNSSQQTIQSCTTFALRHHKYYEDLYRCIIEVMQKATIASRMNLFYFLDCLCTKSKKIEFNKYIDYIQRDLQKIVIDFVCERDDGCFNLVNTLKVLKTWKDKLVMDISIIENAEKSLLEWKSEKTYPPRLKIPRTDILKRIEEDRERSKHLREDIWWVDKSIQDGEAIKLWEECSDLDEGDYLEILAENFKYNPGHPWQEDYKKVLLWNAEQKRLEEEAAALQEKARIEKLEEERIRKHREEEFRIRKLQEETEQNAWKLQEKVDQRVGPFQEMTEHRIQQLQAGQMTHYSRGEEIQQSQDKKAQHLQEEEEARKVWQIIFNEREQSAKRLAEKKEQEVLQQRMIEGKCYQYCEDLQDTEMGMTEITNSHHSTVNVVNNNLIVSQTRETHQMDSSMNPEITDPHPITLGVKRQHCLEDILNDVPDSNLDLKRIRTEDNYLGRNVIINSVNSNNFEGTLNNPLNNNITVETHGSERMEDNFVRTKHFDKKRYNPSGEVGLDENGNISGAGCMTNIKFDNTREVTDSGNYDPSFIYSFSTSNMTPVGETMSSITYGQQSFCNQSSEPPTADDTIEPPRESDTSLPEGYRIDHIAGSKLGLLMQAVSLLESGVSSLTDD